MRKRKLPRKEPSVPDDQYLDGVTPTEPTPEAAQPTRRKPGPRPGTDAAKRGGTAARDKYGLDFYSRIGSQGGRKVRETHGIGFYETIGRRGGESTKLRKGSEHYSAIGRIGGKKAHGHKEVDTAE
jgi:general stress protein YciG